MQRRVRGEWRWATLSPHLLPLLLMVVMLFLFPRSDASSFCLRGRDTHGPRLSCDAHLTVSAVALFYYGSSEINRCAVKSRATAVPGVLMVRAATAESSAGGSEEEAGGTDAWGTIAMKRALNYDSGLKPFMTPWREVRRALRDAGCFSTLALPRLTLPTDRASPRVGDVSPESSTALPPLCRKPLVLMSGRGRDCASCSSFASDVLEHYRAEWEYIRAHVTLVDAGDPMTEELVRNPYPLWYDPAEAGPWMTLTKVSEVRRAEGDVVAAASGASSTSGAPSHDVAQTLQQSDVEDYTLFNMGVRRKAAFLLQSPTVQATHHWSRLVKRAFAGQSEYVLRIVFAYPHNGSVMRDIVNEEVTVGGSQADYLHFFNKAQPFFHCVKKAVRVMDWLQRYGDY
ncbi:conserved hypothetical protein [Leishmania infantum JPCM5]|uniref:Uncharacterized protein n=2 Tax=Leishmania infantum TaxID=5671 RepID=A4HW50_LEIIN|nr:conserved hypothetical protein [Leishmania infantum JPCM5]CAC9469723.1 hypothetical_protein_-_conserved [Leishmania infantum]CAM66672.1 conserved hypothetical protein [Leishmania infantum JPCM5]SUZ40345.1 hypothetical_protein_-_conserved [Leishmania infantum]|eukprot:XP_001464291.1 conserved hypothetical protein [Leishmania infantum JPCM5]